MKISELPEPLKSKALEYQRNGDMKKESDNLINAFPWSGTPEGRKFWNIIDNSGKITTEIVKEYYKDAKEVKCLYNSKKYNIEGIIDSVHYFEDDIWVEYCGENMLLYDPIVNKLAEIVSCKEKPSTSDVNENLKQALNENPSALERVGTLKNPDAKHYELWNDFEAIDVIKLSLTEEEYKGYLKGNILKYKLRDKGQDESDKVKARDYSNELNGLKK